MIVEATSAMPFIGRHAIRPTFLNGRESAREGNIRGKIKSTAVLLGMAVGHGYQAKIGVDLVRESIDNLGGPSDYARLASGGLYAVANTAVTYTQAYLGLKLARENPIPDYETEEIERSDVADQVGKDLALTLAGQAAVFTSVVM